MKLIASVFLLFVTINITLCAAVDYRDQEAVGTGTTLNNAINDALSEAIGRVNGKSIETQTQLTNLELTKVDGDSMDYLASESLQNAVKSATKGVVSSYEVRSKHQSPDGLWTVNIVAKVAKYKASASANRKRIAVMPFWYSEKDFMVDGAALDKNQVTRLMGQGLVAQFVQSRKFTVLDREFIEETMGEKGMIINGDVPVEEMAKIGQELVADYILVGVMEDLSFKTEIRNLTTSSRELRMRSGIVELNYRIIDVATRQIKYADLARINISEGDLQSIDRTLSLSNIDTAMTMFAANRIAKEILNVIYPMLVVSVAGDAVSLNQGGETLAVGEQFEVYQYGERMTDPYTGESLGREEVYCATIEVTRVNPRSSYAEVISSEIDINEIFKPKGLVCRLSQNQNSGEGKAIEAIQAKQSERRTSNNTDW